METIIGILVIFFILVSLFWKQILDVFLFIFVPKEFKLEGDVLDIVKGTVNIFNSSISQFDFTSSNLSFSNFFPVTFYFIEMKYKDGTNHSIEVSQVMFTEIQKQFSEKGKYYLSIFVKKYDWQFEPNCT